ncbi:MAG TPA: Uma2 family endonuclease [Caldilineaceae bacterium]|nr:Uma2 family endonuclease [Caldilineaceae bacterium]
MTLEHPLALATPTHPTQGEWTYQDYLNLPDDGRRYEIIEGVLYVANAPDFDHQFTVSEIQRQLANFVLERQLGQVIPAPFEVHLSPTSRPVQPDVLFIRHDRRLARGAKFFAGAPDLVVEVISPSSIRTDRNIKFAVYEQAGVAEYWIVEPKYGFVEVYTLSASEYALVGQFDHDDVVQSKLLPGLRIIAHTLFTKEF